MGQHQEGASRLAITRITDDISQFPLLTNHRQQESSGSLVDAHVDGTWGKINKWHKQTNEGTNLSCTGNQEDGVLQQVNIQHLLQDVFGNFRDTTASPNVTLLLRRNCARNTRDASSIGLWEWEEQCT